MMANPVSETWLLLLLLLLLLMAASPLRPFVEVAVMIPPVVSISVSDSRSRMQTQGEAVAVGVVVVGVVASPMVRPLVLEPWPLAPAAHRHCRRWDSIAAVAAARCLDHQHAQ